MNSFLLKLSASPARIFAVALSLIVGIASVAYATGRGRAHPQSPRGVRETTAGENCGKE